MSEMPPAGAPKPGPRRYSAGQILMIVMGVILLLPGVCSLFFLIGTMAEVGRKSFVDPVEQLIFAIAVTCFTISAGGIALIVAAVRRSRRP